MNRVEWIEVVREMRARWPHSEIPDATIAVWFDDLADQQLGHVKTAVLAIYREGASYPPNGAQILAKIGELRRDDPDIGQAWKLVTRANVKFGLHREHRQQEALVWLGEQAPAVCEAVKRFGPDALGSYNTDDEGTVRAQFRDIYRAVVRERAHDAAYSGLPDGGFRRLRRVPRKLGEIVAEIGSGK